MKIKTSLTLLGLAAAGVIAAGSDAYAQCGVGYDDAFAIANNYSQARATFAFKTKIGGGGALALCDDLDGSAWSTCWNYRQRCGVFPSGSTAYVNTWNWWVDHSHNHWGFSNALLNMSCFCNPVDGKGAGFQYRVNGVCGSSGPSGCPNWTNEARTGATAHDSDKWHLIWMEKGGDGIKHVFDMATIEVGPGSPIQLWFVNTAGETWGWSNLGASTNWGVNIVNAVEVWVGTAVGFGSPATIAGHTATPRS